MIDVKTEGGNYVERDVNVQNQRMSEGNNNEISIHLNDEKSTLHTGDIAYIRLALFGDTRINFSGLIVKLELLEEKLRVEIDNLKRTVQHLEIEVHDIKSSRKDNIYLVLTSINLLFLILMFFFGVAK